ncbi:GNAT family N-acetyltransferase [Sagittula salina]|uniref:GNAT family N-acetyltransferase n=1 Tax=Sagittula salina TaxID=2820268 RepID=A0A940RZW9_9RHOB|nr:GNAT family N-acetyltransferase [Sagittula salina]MBP0482418.1 GNAT family N-acetyltransferase [Sagittula salina]
MMVEITQNLRDPHHVRRVVFIEEQGFTEAEEWDDRDGDAVQLVVRDAGAPVASARLLRDGTTGKIGRICVLKPYRGRGLGAAMVDFGIAHFRATPGVTRVYLSAQTHALPFYEGLGFRAYGDEYLDGTVPHRDMDLPL